MKVELIFYKLNGKFYSSCEVNIPDDELGFPGSQKAIQSIVNYQDALSEGWQGRYIVTTKELEDGQWWMHLYPASRFSGVVKTQVSAADLATVETLQNES